MNYFGTIIKVEKVVSTFIRQIGRFLFLFAKRNFCPSRKIVRVNYSLSQSNELNNMHPYISGHIYIYIYILIWEIYDQYDF